jgi:group I intron endonuclease
VKQCGIYKITCLPTSKVYVGSSVDLNKRNRDHWSYLARNKHTNPYLQSAWNKYGESAFVFEIIELIDRQMLLERETFWIDALRASDNEFGFNMEPNATSPVHSEETRRKISAALQQPHNRAKYAAAMKERMADPEYAAKVAASRGSEQRRAKMSAHMKRRMADPEYRAKIAASQATPEARARFTAANEKRRQDPEVIARTLAATSKKWIVTAPDGTVYHITNLSAFCREHGLTMANMSQVAHGRQSHCKGWRCEHDYGDIGAELMRGAQ